MSHLSNNGGPGPRTDKKIKLFFEFSGQPGQIDIESISFGPTFVLDNVASIRLASPVTIYPGPRAKGSPLFHYLYNVYRNSGVRPQKLRECLIRAEKQENAGGVIRTVTWTVYKLHRVEVRHASRIKQGGVHYEFDFEDFDIVDRNFYMRTYRG